MIKTASCIFKRRGMLPRKCALAESAGSTLWLVACSLLAGVVQAELAFKWSVEASAPMPYAAEALQGETFSLQATLLQYREPLVGSATATFYYQTPEMGEGEWYAAPAMWDAATALAQVEWSPSMDVGSGKYRYFFGIETEQGKNYRIFGTLRLKASPGFSPAVIDPVDVRAEIVAELREELKPLVDAEAETRATQDGILIAALASEREARAEADADLSEEMAALCTIEALEAETAAREAADNAFFKTDGTRNLGAGDYGWALAGTSEGETVGGWGVRYSSLNLNYHTALRYDFLSAKRGATEERYWFTDAGGEDQIARMKDLASKQDTLTAGENITIEDGTISATVPSITVDTTLNTTSKNPVQNKVVAAALTSEREAREAADTDLSEELEAKSGQLTALEATVDEIPRITVDTVFSATSNNPIANYKILEALNNRLHITRGGTVTGEVVFRGGMRTDSLKTCYGTQLLETVGYYGFKFTGLYQLCAYGSGKAFITAKTSPNPDYGDGTITLDVTTAKATTFEEDGTPLAEKYAPLVHEHAVSDMVVTIEEVKYALSWDSTEGTFALVEVE